MAAEINNKEIKDVLLSKVTGGEGTGLTLMSWCNECMDWVELPTEGPYNCPGCGNLLEVNKK